MISVIIPNYNHARYLRRRIDDVLNQTYKNIELIILDDCSTDNSREIILEYKKRHPFISIHFNKVNQGTFKQWNLGVRMARGEFIWIAESDDLAEPDFLEKAHCILSNNRNLGFVFCDSVMSDERIRVKMLFSDMGFKRRYNRYKSDYLNSGNDEIVNYLCFFNGVNNVSGVLFRKSCYERAGYADHSMRYCGDWHLYIRILSVSDVAYISEPLNTIRFHNDNTYNDYFIKTGYIKEVARVYFHVLKRFKISFTCKLAMIEFLLKILVKMIIYGGKNIFLNVRTRGVEDSKGPKI